MEISKDWLTEMFEDIMNDIARKAKAKEAARRIHNELWYIARKILVEQVKHKGIYEVAQDLYYTADYIRRVVNGRRPPTPELIFRIIGLYVGSLREALEKFEVPRGINEIIAELKENSGA